MMKEGIGIAFLGSVVVLSASTAPHTIAECWEPDTPCSLAPERLHTGIWGSAADDVWVVGASVPASTGTFAHWDGTTWTRGPTQDGPALWGVWGTARDDVWAVANRGMVLHRQQGVWKVSRSGA